ncbi:MAG: insulinase family protein, partial [bacterium]|nr:insulinase family protein [bacterium]
MSSNRYAYLFISLLTLSIACTPASQLSTPPQQPPSPQAEQQQNIAPPKHPLDKSEYRRFVLENGVKVLLVSDSRFNKSAASVLVGVGSLSNPRNRLGLAHFLEHMLFLGTEKYPGVDDYGTYWKQNGGYKNAYTSSDHTNYYLEINHDAFEGALDRLSQFFIAPLFTETYT